MCGRWRHGRGRVRCGHWTFADPQSLHVRPHEAQAIAAGYKFLLPFRLMGGHPPMQRQHHHHVILPVGPRHAPVHLGQVEWNALRPAGIRVELWYHMIRFHRLLPERVELIGQFHRARVGPPVHVVAVCMAVRMVPARPERHHDGRPPRAVQVLAALIHQRTHAGIVGHDLHDHRIQPAKHHQLGVGLFGASGRCCLERWIARAEHRLKRHAFLRKIEDRFLGIGGGPVPATLYEMHHVLAFQWRQLVAVLHNGVARPVGVLVRVLGDGPGELNAEKEEDRGPAHR
jgi:hypothetical protein